MSESKKTITCPTGIGFWFFETDILHSKTRIGKSTFLLTKGSIIDPVLGPHYFEHEMSVIDAGESQLMLILGTPTNPIRLELEFKFKTLLTEPINQENVWKIGLSITSALSVTFHAKSINTQKTKTTELGKILPSGLIES